MEVSTYKVLKDFAGPVATVIASCVAMIVTWKLSSRQHAIATAQANIARDAARTAKEKVVLDLFDRRMQVYDELRSVVGRTIVNGAAKQQDLNDFARATDRVEVLFGPEVVNSTKELSDQLYRYHAAQRRLEHAHDQPTRDKAADDELSAFEKIKRILYSRGAVDQAIRQIRPTPSNPMRALG